MALKDTVKDPLNWVLLFLALAFGYYVTFIPYWQNYYLKTPQVMTLQEYLDSPSHPRPPMARALGTPPPSIEIIVTDLRVAHVDADSILLEATGMSSSTAARPAPPPQGNAGGAEDTDDQTPTLVFGEERPVPNNQILIAGDNMDLLELSLGQEVELQVFALHESPLGWVPKEPELERETEEFFTKEEIDELDRMKILANGNIIPIPYVETGEMRFADGVHPPGQPATLEELADDTAYIQTVNALGGGTVDVHDVRLMGRLLEQLAPYLWVEDAEGRRARVFYNPRLLSEWYWALDRLEGQPVVVRGLLKQLSPAELRMLEGDDNVHAVMDGFAILSPDGAVVINLENPTGDLGTPIQ